MPHRATASAVELAPRVLARAGRPRAGLGERRVTLQRAEDTERLGARLAEAAQAGDVVLLHGDYGAGKTCLARGFVRRW